MQKKLSLFSHALLSGPVLLDRSQSGVVVLSLLLYSCASRAQSCCWFSSDCESKRSAKGYLWYNALCGKESRRNHSQKACLRKHKRGKKENNSKKKNSTFGWAIYLIFSSSVVGKCFSLFSLNDRAASFRFSGTWELNSGARRRENKSTTNTQQSGQGSGQEAKRRACRATVHGTYKRKPGNAGHTLGG